MESHSTIRIWLLSVLLAGGMSLPMLQAVGQCACTGGGSHVETMTSADNADACDSCCDSNSDSSDNRDDEPDDECPVDHNCPKPCCATTVTPVTTRAPIVSPFIEQPAGHTHLFIVNSPSQDLQFDLLRPPRA